MKDTTRDYIESHGNMGHDWITSGSASSADWWYSYIESWGVDSTVTYTQEKGDGTEATTTGETLADGRGVHGNLKTISVTGSGKLIAYRKRPIQS